ncbi:hypothetical protein NQ317_019027 [Molorchus minor]|uniref:BTB/POZ domain-containing protein n=1 Tax=Molorchus minor TaxID=1323400 RepID=A0ABQ9JCB8_9CUCU|nr:hypothetical protein NQ317_019027 [Molorchus minor]
MVRHLEQMKKDRLRNGFVSPSNTKTLPGNNCGQYQRNSDNSRQAIQDSYECVALHVSPDLGERIMLSGDRSILEEIFPETNQAVMDARSGVAWNQQDAHHVIRSCDSIGRGTEQFETSSKLILRLRRFWKSRILHFEITIPPKGWIKGTQICRFSPIGKKSC